MTSLTKHPSPHRTRLLETSADLFWTHGYRATTTRRIAAKLGLQQASLYHHVASKEDLLQEICAASLAQLLDTTEASILGVRDPRARVEAVIRASIEALIAHQKEHATMAFELRALSADRQPEVMAVLGRYRALIRSTLADAQAAGALRKDIDVRYLNLALLNLLTWILVWYRPGDALDPSQVADLMLDVYMNGAAANRSGVARPPATPAAAASVAAASDDEELRTSDRLLKVAAKLFRTKGYDGTTAREIASVLGIQKASLYHHTRGKAHVLHSVCSSALQQIRADVLAATTGVADPLDRMSRLVVAHVDSLLRHQDQHAAALLETRSLTGDHYTSIATLRDEHESAVRAAVSASQDAGALRSDISAKYLSLALMSLTNRSMLWYRPDGDLAPGALGEIFAALFLGGASRLPD